MDDALARQALVRMRPTLVTPAFAIDLLKALKTPGNPSGCLGLFLLSEEHQEDLEHIEEAQIQSKRATVG